MKYPLVLIYRYDNYNYIDELFKESDPDLKCTVELTSDMTQLNKLFNSNYHVLVTFGKDEKEYQENVNSIIANRMRKQWIHLTSITDMKQFSHSVNSCYINYALAVDRTIIRPTFSMFTTTYNSYEKIIRAYNSLTTQILKDWEWVILDDSPDDKHFAYLTEHLDGDNRIRLYKRSKNSGSIGNVKNEAISLCRGQYVLELDHDDELAYYTLSDSARVFEENPDVGFVYMDFINIYENQTNFQYGDFYGKGYCGYYLQKYKDKWVYASITPNINNVTISSLVCLPNHPRIWRKSVLMSLGNYNEYLPICDDLEILLRTVHKTKIAKIPKIGYVQYMNNNNNNFSLIRNSEINRLQPNYIVPIFNNKYNIKDHLKELDAFEDESYASHPFSKIWTRKDYTYKYCNKIIQYDYDAQYCILGLESFYLHFNRIKTLYQNPRNDFLFLEENANVFDLINLVEKYNLTRIKCYTMNNTTDNEFIKYFNMVYKSCTNSEIISVDSNIRKLKLNVAFNTAFSFRHDMVNSLSTSDQTYLEIGVEYGTTFNNVHCLQKTGVDPSPKFNDDRVVLKTSDDFFKDNQSTYDIIFIDGMHQVEYFVKDFANSLNVLNTGGMIILDDILPISYNEQLDIPIKHYYEHGILKYGEPWTGPIWKSMYYLLQYYSDNITFSYYNNGSYRGVGVLTNINKFTLNIEEATTEMLTYQYYTDFEKYLTLIHKHNTNK